MVEISITFNDEIQALWLLRTLSALWETFKSLISNFTPNGVITMNLVKVNILNKDMRRKTLGSTSHSKVLITENEEE